MRSLTSLLLSTVIASIFVLIQAEPVLAARIEAEKGKHYTLSPEHGPWMIMVTTLWGDTREQLQHAVKAADDMVYELRRHGIPAYVYSQDLQVERIATKDRLGRADHRVYASQKAMVGVLAGNYPSLEDSKAQKTLKAIKNYRPKVLKTAGFNETQNGQGPLHRAFLTLNPLLSPEDLARQNRDPLIKQLNQGAEHSLTENRGKYSLIVASFYGKSQVKSSKFAEFDKLLKRKDSLTNAAVESWALTRTMRSRGMEAYIYHDRYRSIVTIGSFDSPSDPRIPRLVQMFCAKYRKHPNTGQEVLVSEAIQVPSDKKGAPPLKSWTMDPEPKLIEVPRIN